MERGFARRSSRRPPKSQSLCDTAWVSPKQRAPVLIAILAVLCGGSVWGVAWYRARPVSPGMLLKRIPSRDATVVVYIDFDQLRKAGVLQLIAGPKTNEDPDYGNFVRKINFDYRQDLDVAMISFTPTGKYVLAKGRFDWKSLRNYAIEQGGRCVTSTCKMSGSTRERQISFFPLQSGLLALAVSPDDAAVTDMTVPVSRPPAEVPNAPIWVMVPGALLKSGENLPNGTKMFAHGMEKADKVTLTLSPEGDHLAARLEVRCRNEQDAVEVSSQLASATLTLRQMLEREHQKPSPTDLAGVLTSGSFRSEGQTVFGYWPMDRSFIETILAGG